VQYHLNGELVPAEEATVSVRDRGFRYGDAGFETVRAYGGDVFEFGAHVRRLERTCERLGMADAVPDRDDLAARIDETLRANDLRNAYVRLSVTRGVQPGKLTPAPDVDPTVVVVVQPLPRGGVARAGGEAVWADPAVVRTVPTRRIPDEALPADAKTHNYLNGVLARLELRRTVGDSGPDPGRGPDTGTDGAAADEALVRDIDGNVAEGAASNVFFVDDGTLKTPAEGRILPGVTRRVVLELAEKEPFPVETGSYEVAAVRRADEAFLTNTTWELRPVASVDGHPVGGGPVTRLMTRLFDERVERRHYGESDRPDVEPEPEPDPDPDPDPDG